MCHNETFSSISPLDLKNDFKFFYSSEYMHRFDIKKLNTQPKFFCYNNRENLFVLKSFKLYVKINIYNPSNFRVNNSFFFSYLSFSSANTSVNNISRFFGYYKTFFQFISNIFYYKLPFLSFGNSAFKKEVLALNWFYLSKFSYIWRYTKPFVFFTSNKIHNEMLTLFHNYSLLNFNTAAVLDVFYHSKTIHYLNKTGFYTFGLVPTNTVSYTLNFSIPTTQESILSQVFFMRFLLVSKKHTNRHLFNDLFNKWRFLKCFFLN